MSFNKTRYQGKRLAVPDGRGEQGRAAEEKTEIVEPAADSDRNDLPAQQAADASALPETKPADKEEKPGFWANYGYLLVTAAVVLLVFRVLLQLAYVPSGSMEMTIPTDSLLVSWQMPYLVSDPQPQRGDVITFWNREMGKLLVKRVIGLPGEEITFSGGYVYIDGQRLEEDYLPAQGITRSDKTFVVPEGCLFMMGDNREHSTDSRYWDDPYTRVSDVRARVLICIPVKRHPVGFLPNWDGIPLPVLKDIHLIG